MTEETIIVRSNDWNNNHDKHEWLNCLVIYIKNVSFILKTEGTNTVVIVLAVIGVAVGVIGIMIGIYWLMTVKSRAKVGIAGSLRGGRIVA